MFQRVSMRSGVRCLRTLFSGTISLFSVAALLLPVPICICDACDNEMQEYKGKDQSTVLKRVRYKTTGTVKKYVDTYYIHDDLDNLITMSAPKAVEKIKRSVATQ